MDLLEYGVCRLSVVPVRAEASNRSEQITQLLFGEHYEVIEVSKDRKWVRIRIVYDHYEGWIDAIQHHMVSKEYFDYLDRAEYSFDTM